MNNKFYISLPVIVMSATTLFAQTPLDVTESTLKVAALTEEVFYYGFAEGDQIIFNLDEVQGKELKEVEIIEMPSSSKFMDFKSKKIINKTLTVTKTGIYKFRFYNSSIGGRVCKYKIQRLPSSSAFQNFNTSVYWRTINDTTYSMEDERHIVKSDTIINNITDQVALVHSLTGGVNKTTFNFKLPDNTISWSYYIGVDQAGQEAFVSATKELSSKAAPLVAKIPGYGPMAALALGSASYLAQLEAGEDIDFYIVAGENVNLFMMDQAFHYIKKGKVINDFSRMTSPLNGMYHVCLYNDNAVTGVKVNVKITAISVDQIWNTRQVQKMRVSSRQEAYLKN